MKIQLWFSVRFPLKNEIISTYYSCASEKRWTDWEKRKTSIEKQTLNVTLQKNRPQKVLHFEDNDWVNGSLFNYLTRRIVILLLQTISVRLPEQYYHRLNIRVIRWFWISLFVLIFFFSPFWVPQFTISGFVLIEILKVPNFLWEKGKRWIIVDSKLEYRISMIPKGVQGAKKTYLKFLEGYSTSDVTLSLMPAHSFRECTKERKMLMCEVTRHWSCGLSSILNIYFIHNVIRLELQKKKKLMLGSKIWNYSVLIVLLTEWAVCT